MKIKSLLLSLLVFLFSFFSAEKTLASYQVESNTVQTKVGAPVIEPNNFVLYCQSDPAWSNICGLGWAGCGPTTMAMILTYFDQPITPPEVDQIFQSRGSPRWRYCSEDSGSNMVEAISTLLPERGFTVKLLTGSTYLDLNQAKDYLNNKYLIIGSVKKHIFVVDGVDITNNTVHLQDPDVKCTQPNGYNAPAQLPWQGYPWYYAYAVKKT